MTDKKTYRTWTDTTDFVTAAMLNEQIRDNGNATWVGTNGGDIDFYSSGSTKQAIAIGTSGQVLESSGSQPYWGSYEGCKTYLNGSQSIADSTNTEITSLDTEYFDTNNFHSTTSGSIIIPTGMTGLYVIGALGYFGGNATANKLRHIEVAVNSGSICGEGTTNGNSDLMYISTQTIHILNAGDKVTLKVKQTSGGALSFFNPTLWIARLK